MSESNWKRLFGTPEKVARYIAENCCSDCYACVVDDGPCIETFGEWDRERHERELLEWLEQEVGE